MSERFFLAFTAGVGVVMGAGIAAESLPLPPLRSVAVLVVAGFMVAFVYLSLPHVAEYERVEQ